MTRITASMTAYSAMSCPSSPRHSLRTNSIDPPFHPDASVQTAQVLLRALRGSSQRTLRSKALAAKSQKNLREAREETPPLCKATASGGRPAQQRNDTLQPCRK